MAITLLNQPDSIAASYRPVKWDVQKNRLGGESVAITDTQTNMTFARYIHASGAFDDALVGDIVLGSGFSDDTYNIRQEINQRTSTTTRTDFVPSPPTNGMTGTITRVNDNFQLKGECWVYNKDKVEITGVKNPGGGLIKIIAPGNDYKQGDIVEVSETTDYNAIYVIDSIFIDADSFLVEATYVDSQTGKVKGAILIGSKRQQLIKVGSDELFRFDFSNFLQASLTFDLASLGQLQVISPTAGSVMEYVIRFIEEFDDKDGLVKTADSTVTSIKRATNITLQHKETQDLDVFRSNNTSQRFLTNAPDDKLIKLTEEEQLSFLTTLTAMNYNVSTYDINGGLVLSTNKTIQDITNFRGVVPVIPPTPLNYSYFEIKLIDGGAVIRSETRKFTIDTKCYDKPRRFWFLNRLSGFDAFTFTGDISEQTRSRQTKYERDLGFSFVVKDRGDTVLGVKASENFEAISDFLTKDEADWLVEMLTSPLLFIQEGSDFIPIIISSRRQVTFDTDKLIQFKIKYTYANELILQGN